MIRRPPRSPLFPSTPLSRSLDDRVAGAGRRFEPAMIEDGDVAAAVGDQLAPLQRRRRLGDADAPQDRKSTRLNSSHSQISYAVFCLKKKKKIPRSPSDNQRR